MGVMLLVTFVIMVSPYFPNAFSSFNSRGYFTTADFSDTIQMRSGWNFISIPYKGAVITSNCNIGNIYHYNAVSRNYQKIESLDKLKPGLGYWVNTDECAIKLSEEDKKEIANGGDSPVTGYDSSSWRGKFFDTNINNIQISSGTISQICVYSNGVKDLVLGLRASTTTPEIYEVKMNTVFGWECVDTSLEWKDSSLFIYKKSGAGVISYSSSTPYDSYYSNDLGKTWNRDNWKRGIKVVMGSQRKVIDNSSIGDDFGKLKKGWNQIGSGDVLDLSKYSGECNFKLIYSYDAGSKSFVLTKKIFPGKGYWIYVANDCSISPTPIANTGGTLVCSSGYNDCDKNSANACEVNLKTDSKNCGACGKQCNSGYSCKDGSCIQDTIIKTDSIGLLVNDANSLSETETGFYTGLQNDGNKVELVAYLDATLDKLQKYKTIFVLEYNEKLKADVLYQLYTAGADIKLIGSASKYVNELNINDPSVEVS